MEVQRLNFHTLRGNYKVIVWPDYSQSIYSNKMYFRESIKGEQFLELSVSQALALM